MSAETTTARSSGKGSRPATERDELDKWSDALPSRRIVDDFLEWCEEHKYEVCEWIEEAKWPVPTQSRDRLLNRYFEINEKRLEDQRRALLESASE